MDSCSGCVGRILHANAAHGWCICAPRHSQTRGNAMRSLLLLGLLGSVSLGSMSLAASQASAATISGTVVGPDGAPMRAVFEQARHPGMKMTVSVLTDNQGKYFVESLPAGDYDVSIRATGYKADPKPGMKLSADQNASQDFRLQTALIDWTDISIYQGLQLLPDA